MSATTVSPTISEQFWDDGVVVLRGVLDQQWLDLLAIGIDKNRADLSDLAHLYSSDDEADGYWGDYCNWDRFDEYRRFLFESPAASHAAGVLGSETIRLFHEHVLVKEPATTEVTPWHHDLPYYCLQGRQLASTWIPLDPVPESVCPQFLAGSHLGPVYAPRKFADGEAYYQDADGFELFPGIETAGTEDKVRRWALEPGDCIVFHMRTLHNAPATPDHTDRRRAFSARWLGDDALFDTRPGDTSPPYPELHAALSPGDELPADVFPLLWSANDR